MIKYMVYPGWVESISDGDLHWITAGRLMELHGVKPSECIIQKEEYPGRIVELDLLPIYPRKDGKYPTK